MLNALLARYKTPRDNNSSEVSEVSQVQASDANGFADTSAGFHEVSGVSPKKPTRPADTSDTSRFLMGYQPKALPIQACTPDTSDTPQNEQHPQKTEDAEKHGADFPGPALILERLESIGEGVPAIDGEAFDQCANDPDTLKHFTGRPAARLLSKVDIKAALPRSDDGADDDRITCGQCLMLAFGGACMAAKRGELATATSRNYRPAPDRMRRCEGYLPRGEGDQRTGMERWPELTDTGETRK